LRYHELTKHSYYSVRRETYSLDWANQPSPYKRYLKSERQPLPKGSLAGLPPTLELLRSLNEPNGPVRGPASLTELSEFIGLSKPSVYRLLCTLQEFRLVSKDPHSGLYRPGAGLLELAHQGLERFELRSVAQPQLEKLWKDTNETVHLAILDEGEVVYLEKRESRQTIRMYSAVGRRAPAHCTGLGKAILAYLPSKDRHDLLKRKGLRRYTDRTIISLSEFERECEEIRKRGYALDLGEHEEEIRCVAAPIFDHTGQPVAAVSIAIPAFRTDLDHLHVLGPKVQEAARSISRKMGCPKDLWD